MFAFTINLFNGRMNQIYLWILLCQAKHLLTKGRFIEIVIGCEYDILSCCEGDAMIPLFHQILPAKILLITIIPDARIMK